MQSLQDDVPQDRSREARRWSLQATTSFHRVSTLQQAYQLRRCKLQRFGNLIEEIDLT